jgi:hypothetical protein
LAMIPYGRSMTFFPPQKSAKEITHPRMVQCEFQSN